jgi:hypothetical protein
MSKPIKGRPDYQLHPQYTACVDCACWSGPEGTTIKRGLQMVKTEKLRNPTDEKINQTLERISRNGHKFLQAAHIVLEDEAGREHDVYIYYEELF